MVCFSTRLFILVTVPTVVGTGAAYLDSSSGENGQPLLGRQHLDEAQDEHLHGDALQGGVQCQPISHLVGLAVHCSHAIKPRVDIRKRPAPCIPWDFCPNTGIRHCRCRTQGQLWYRVGSLR